MISGFFYNIDQRAAAIFIGQCCQVGPQAINTSAYPRGLTTMIFAAQQGNIKGVKPHRFFTNQFKAVLLHQFFN
jgi:hypothetical protein